MKRGLNEKRLLRIIDANFNRLKEGLRVCEDLCRFILDNQKATLRYKKIRHNVSQIMKETLNDLVKARDIAGDVGKSSLKIELERESFSDIYFANAQRIKESLRVLEELTKLLNPKKAVLFKKLRYEAYALEKEIAKKF